MSDVNRDPIRWERSMTQDKEGQYVSYHDYATLLAEYDALRAAQQADEHVAWLRYNDHNGQRPTTLHLCDSDAQGALKVYRAAQQAKVPDDVLPSAVELLTRVERHPENMLGDTLLRSNVRTFLEKIAAQSAQEGKV